MTITSSKIADSNSSTHPYAQNLKTLQNLANEIKKKTFTVTGDGT